MGNCWKNGKASKTTPAFERFRLRESDWKDAVLIQSGQQLGHAIDKQGAGKPFCVLVHTLDELNTVLGVIQGDKNIKIPVGALSIFRFLALGWERAGVVPSQLNHSRMRGGGYPSYRYLGFLLQGFGLGLRSGSLGSGLAVWFASFCCGGQGCRCSDRCCGTFPRL